MKIAILSDIHDNEYNLEKCLGYIKAGGAGGIIFCGDAANADTLKYLSKNFSGMIHLVRGNMEIYDDKEIINLKNIKNYGRVGRTEIGGKKIGFCHEPFLIPKVLEIGTCDIVFYGHTHKPWIEKKNGVTLANPGNLSGTFYNSTFAVYDTESGELELKITERL